MPNDIANLIEASLRTVLEHNSWTFERDVLWGNASGQFIVANPNYLREVYWHSLATEDQEVGIAILDGDCNLLYQENAEFAANPPRITIGYPPRSKLLHVKGVAKTQEGNSAQGNLSQSEQYMARIANPYITNLIDFHVRPTDTLSTMVYVEAGMYEQPSIPGVKQRWLGGVLDLASQITALTSGQHQLAVIIYDTEAGTLSASTTTAVSAIGGLPARPDLSSISTITLTAGQRAIGTVYLYYGQTTVTSDDCLTALDPRLSDPPVNGFARLDSSGNLNLHDHQLQNAVVYSETEVTTASSGSTLTLDTSVSNVRQVTLTANCTFTFSNPPATGKAGTLSLILVQDGTGSRTVTWPASVKWSGGTAPTLSTTPGAIDILTFLTVDGGTTFFGFLSGLAFA